MASIMADHNVEGHLVVLLRLWTTVQDATHALELLRPLIRAEQYHAARTDLAVLERK
jgi:hypothetical protein